MTELTAEKVRLVMLEICQRRIVGRIPAGAAVSPEAMARLATELGVPLDEKTFRRAERSAVAAARLALRSLHPEAQ